MRKVILVFLWLVSVCLAAGLFHRDGYRQGYAAGEKLPIVLANKPHGSLNLSRGSAYLTLYDRKHTVPIKLGAGSAWQINGLQDSIYTVLHDVDFFITRVEENK